MEETQIEVPRLVDLPLEKATEELIELNLKLGDVTYKEDDQPENTVLDQEPKPGSKCYQGSDVHLVISRMSYARYLPIVFQRNALEANPLSALLWISQHILSDFEDKIENIDIYFDPHLVGEDFLPWLASWVDLRLDEGWSNEKRRKIIKIIAELHRWRGTVKGFKYMLDQLMEIEVKVKEREWPKGMEIGQRSSIGIDTVLIEEADPAYCFVVEWKPKRPIETTTEFIKKARALMDAEKPAFTKCYLKIIEPPKEEKMVFDFMVIGVTSTVGWDCYIG